MAITTKISTWRKVRGFADRCNDIIYKSPVLSPSQDILVYFGGDVQDTNHNMQKHIDSKKYIQWSLENTAQLLSTNFPKQHILIIRPVRMHITSYAAFSCYDNFVLGDAYGVPQFQSRYNALHHLKELLNNTIENLRAYGTINEPNLSHIKLSLMGFSKGCIVLNQFLHEFYYYLENKECDNKMYDFLKCIKSMWWLDGGHGGEKDTWITNEALLKTISKLEIAVHVHVTPYQIEDAYRPWICKEENIFTRILESTGVKVQRTLHFGDKPRSLTSHFNVLKVVAE